ncbi:MAG: HD domain-containing protein [Burkholderiales bacterium]|nr:HD domain-containing protein [Burkholderiales bacterium]
MANFINLANATVEELAIIAEEQAKAAHLVADRLVNHLDLLKGDFAGFPIDRYTHCLQAASRAYNDKRDAEYVVCALFHDMGDMLAPYNHGEFIAEVLRPYISEQNHWILAHHGEFQGYYFWGKIGLNKDKRNEYDGNPYFEATVEFCEKYDCPSFDPKYPTLSIDVFIPLIKEVVGNLKVPNAYADIFNKG